MALLCRTLRLPVSVARTFTTAASLPWFPAAGGNASLPFRMRRTASGNLPIYKSATNNGRVTTIVRNLEGDLDAAGKLFNQICQSSGNYTVSASKVTIKGNHLESLIQWAKENKL